MVRVVIRAFHWLSCVLPSLALAVGLVGVCALPAEEVPVGSAVEVGLVDPTVMRIDRVLASRIPDLGLTVRRRVAETIVEEARRAQFDPMLVLGLIETESSFIGDAVSVAGARGLVQLMPVTLDYVASLEGVRLTSDEVYRDPAMQVRLGVRYLSRLKQRFGSLDLALMAYNGGPGRLDQALQEGDADAWFGNYVRTVRLHQARFARRLAPSSLAQRDRPRLYEGTDVALMR